MTRTQRLRLSLRNILVLPTRWKILLMWSHLMGGILHPEFWTGQRREHCPRSMVLVNIPLAAVSRWFGSGEVTQELALPGGYSGPGWSLRSPSLQVNHLILLSGPAMPRLATCPWQLPALSR